MEGSDVLSVLGRPFRPQEARMVPNDDEIDELSLQWLNAQTKLCQVCGARIMKESGCDLMECVCGWRFCYNCGEPGDHCDCNPGHYFENNDESYEEVSESILKEGPILDANGSINLKACILRKEVRMSRMEAWEENDYEEDDTWTFMQSYFGDVPLAPTATFNGRWLFTPKTNAGSIRMLMEQLRFEEVRVSRERRRRERLVRTIVSAHCNN